jgi:hypothetical protein
MLVKLYDELDGKKHNAERKYSPKEYCGSVKTPITGRPNEARISISYVERQHLTMRTGMRRIMRLSNGFSENVETHMYAVSLHFMYYNFEGIHKMLRVTATMKAGESDQGWSLEKIAALAP